MARIPKSIAGFLSGRRIGVAGVSRQGGHVGNVVFRKLRSCGYEVFPINPMVTEVEGVRCFPDVGTIPHQLDGVVVATHPAVSAEIVRQCGEHRVARIWLHRSFGNGSVSEGAIRQSDAYGIECIVGGCPLMFCEPVDLGHKCMKWLLQWQGRVPG